MFRSLYGQHEHTPASITIPEDFHELESYEQRMSRFTITVVNFPEESSAVRRMPVLSMRIDKPVVVNPINSPRTIELQPSIHLVNRQINSGKIISRPNTNSSMRTAASDATPQSDDSVAPKLGENR